LPGELQEFLLRCSVLSELTAPRCEQISGNPRAARLLEDLERRRLFISVLDSEELVLRLHDLFRDFLEERLRRLYPEEVPVLLRRAAKGEADPLRRTLTYLRAGAWDEAQQSVADAAPDMLASGEGDQVIRVIEQFPAYIQAQSPLLAYSRGLCEWWQYHYVAVQPLMAHAAAGFDALGRHDDAQHARAMQALAMFFCGQMEEARRLGQAVRSQAMDLETETLSELLDFWYEGHHGPISGPGEHLTRMIDLLMRGGSAELWSRCMPRINTFLARPGVSTQVQRLLQGARVAAGDHYWSLHANANLTEAWLLFWQGRFTELKATFQRLEEDSRWLGQSVSSLIRLLILKNQYQIVCDDKDAVQATCEAIVAQAPLRDGSSNLRFGPLGSLGLVARFYTAIEDWPAVRMQLRSLNVEVSRESPSTQMLICILKAQLALQEGRVDEALAMFRELVTRSSQLDTVYFDAIVRTRLALAELAVGSPTAAWRALEPLIENVLASGNVGQILGSGVQSLTELSRAPWGSAASKRGLAALRMWVDTARQLKAGSHEKPLALAPQDAGLSVRELEVLALLGQGQSNKLIARALNLSPHTVKRHVARILDRLDLSSRMQAADWYRALEMQGKKT
jgi:LuxR family transcriptional regulator, maltose regulon positive regulatory protein